MAPPDLVSDEGVPVRFVVTFKPETAMLPDEIEADAVTVLSGDGMVVFACDGGTPVEYFTQFGPTLPLKYIASIQVFDNAGPRELDLTTSAGRSRIQAGPHQLRS